MYANKFGKGLVLFLVGALFGAVAVWSIRAAPAKGDAVYQKLEIFAQVLHYVKTNYVDPVDDKALIYGAIKGMMDTLDSHSSFMPPDLFKELKIDTTGEFPGLGLILDYGSEGTEGFVVVSVLPGTPAAKGGIKPGDVLLKIDGKELADKSLPEVVRLMRGPVGSTVVLTVSDEDGTNVRNVLLHRSIIRLSSVDSRLIPPVGYIRIRSFQNSTSEDVRRILMSWFDGGSSAGIKGIVLDLRDNPGGLLEEAVSVADMFLSKGVIVSIEGRNRFSREIDKAHKKNTIVPANVPVVVLINGGSASAAEVLSAALLENGRARLVGEKSYGKGTVQNIIDLDDGSGLKITVARYFTPKHNSINDTGILPDTIVPDPKRLVESAERARDSLPPQIKKLITPLPEDKQVPALDWQLTAAYRLIAGA